MVKTKITRIPLGRLQSQAYLIVLVLLGGLWTGALLRLLERWPSGAPELKGSLYAGLAVILISAVILIAVEILVCSRIKALVEMVHQIERGADSGVTEELSSSGHHGELEELGRALANLTDILKQRQGALDQAQDQLIRSEKMAMVGQLTAGIVHEISNPLTGILGMLELTLASVPVNAQWRKDLEVILRETQRIKGIVAGLLTFARHNDSKPQTIEVGDILQGTISFMEHQAKAGRVKIENSAPRRLFCVQANPAELRQVFMNVIVNALQAMPLGGTLTIGCSRRGDSLGITFQDTGCGIAAQNLAKIFDPLFTTKEAGQGTGLGLFISLNIMRRLGGDMTVVSGGQSQGAVVTVIFFNPGHRAVDPGAQAGSEKSGSPIASRSSLD
ncbi:MAG: hypothetical protein HY401_02650 [Elusimicrobia bacterium]|nr:hypothetical protein [Elusimicrobiota bacterium]